MAMGGVGEAMLLGAAMGGGSAALTGGDPLKGALMGGLTGGIGGAISPALSAMTGGVPAAAILPEAAAATNMAPTVANAAAMNAAAVPVATATAPAAATGFTQIPAGQTFAQASQAAMNPIPAPGSLGSGTFKFFPEAQSSGIDALLKPTAATPTVTASAAPPVRATGGTFTEGMKRFIDDPMASIKANPMTAVGAAIRGATGARKKLEEPDEYDGPLKRFKFNPDSYQPSFFAAEGGIANLAAGGYDRMVGEDPMYMSNMASGGIANLGSYSDGGRMLKGPGDGMSDSIPASISGKRPARLADGEFVVPADVVSHLGNGSTDAGAKQLYAMMNKVRQARTGRKSQGREIDPRQYMAA
jgi:hypothetical protein